MFDRLRTWLLRVLRVPPEPEPPFGAPGSVRVFRAARNFYKLRLFGWGLAQAGALLGIVISLGFLGGVEREFVERKAAGQSTASNTNTASRIAAANEPSAQRAAPLPARENERSAPKAKGKRSSKDALTRFVAWVPVWVFPVLSLVELAGIGIFVVQAFVTYTVLRLDYEMRWYIVTDRSLRIRSKIWSVQELTMSFANLQQVVLSQGPLQRWLGIADVRVQSAGGGGSKDAHHHGDGNSMHTGIFQGVDNASEVRDLILNRLRQFRETGLGDPDERQQPSPTLSDAATATAAVADSKADVLGAARELLVEARQLRIRIEQR